MNTVCAFWWWGNMESALFICRHRKLYEHVAVPAATKALCIISHCFSQALLCKMMPKSSEKWSYSQVFSGKIERHVGNSKTIVVSGKLAVPLPKNLHPQGFNKPWNNHALSSGNRLHTKK